MLYIILMLVTLIPSLISRRLMGGLISDWFKWWPGTQAARVLWSILLFAFSMSLNGYLGFVAPWWLLLTICFSFPIGAIIVGDSGMGLKTVGDYFQMIGYGLAMSAIACGITFYYTMSWHLALIFAATGLLTMAVYQIAKWFPINIPVLGMHATTPNPDFTPLGEIYTSIIETIAIIVFLLLL